MVIRAYLAGAIEKAPDGGKHWRGNIKKFLREEIHHKVWDPTEKEYEILTDEEKKHFRQWKESDRPRFLKTVHKIIDNDLYHLTKKTDYIIAYWDKFVLGGGGTHGEITIAYLYKIPVYLVLGMPIADVSGWIVGCSTEIFQDFESLKSFLREKYVN